MYIKADVVLWCLAVSDPLLQPSYPALLWNPSLWSSRYRQDASDQGCGQRQRNELHQHQGSSDFGSHSLQDFSLVFEENKVSFIEINLHFCRDLNS